MAPKSFPQFPFLPQEIQNDIWRWAANQAIDTPSVHYLEMFAIEPRHYGWHEMARLVRRMQQGELDDDSDDQDIDHNPFEKRDSFYPPVKLAIPQIFPDTRLSSGYYTTVPRLAQVSVAAREEVTRAANARAKENNTKQQLPGIHVDLSGDKRPVSLTINAEEDLVYLHQPITKPCAWNAMEYIKRLHMKSIILEHYQTKNIRRILLPFQPEKYVRHCLGCHQLRYHHEQLTALSVKRSRDRQARAQHGVKPACKMCRKVKQQAQLNPDSADETTIRERLLKERMVAMLPEVRQRCADTGHSLDLSLYRSPARGTSEDENDDDDTVSICSADVDPDDDFAWYNNSRELLVVNEIPYPAHILSGATLPDRFKQLYPRSISQSPFIARTQFHPPTCTRPNPPTSPNRSQSIDYHNHHHNNININKPIPKSNNRNHHHSHQHNNRSKNNRSKNNRSKNNNPTPKHGTHPNCNTTAYTTPFDEHLPSYFPRCSSVYIVDYGLKLRAGVTALPAEGRRWYTSGYGEQRGGVFVEVVDLGGVGEVGEECWVWDGVGSGGGGSGSGSSGGDSSSDGDGEASDGGEAKGEVGVVEFVRWLREWWRGVRYFDVDTGEYAVRTVDVGVVAYLELDGEGRVRSE